MLRSYFTAAARNLLRQKAYAAINLGGLGEGVPISVPGAQPITARGMFADAGFFELFDFARVAGTPIGAFDDVDGMVLSAAMARRCFGGADPIGQTLRVVHRRGASGDYVVRGVVEVPSNSSLTFDFVISHRVRGDFAGSSWGMCHVLTFTRLPPDMSRRAAEGVLTRLVEQHVPAEQHRRWGGETGIGVRLLPLTDMHLTQGLREIPAVLDPVYLLVVAGIALGVLAIACVNYINLALALTARRVREVGIRKTSGATRHQLVRQFLAESTLVALLSVSLGVALAELALPAFGAMLAAPVQGTALSVAVGAAVLAVGIGLVAGGYPAVVLSRFEAVEVLRGRLRFGGTGWFSRGMVLAEWMWMTMAASISGSCSSSWISSRENLRR